MTDNQAQSAPTIWHQDLTTLAAVLPGAAHAAAAAWRDDARRALAASGFPTTRDESWRYTDVRSVLKTPFHQTIAANGDDRAVERAAALVNIIDGANSIQIVVANGQVLPSPGAALPDGVSVTSLADALRQDAAAVMDLVGRQGADVAHGFWQANQAAMGQGVIVSVAPRCVVERPIEIVYVNAGEAALAVHPRTLIVVEEAAEASVIERYLGDGGGHLTNAVTEVTVAPAARLEHLRLQQDNTRNSHIGGLFVGVGRDASYVSHNVNIGARLARVEVIMRLVGDGASGVMNGLYLGSGKQHLDNYTHIEHCQNHGTSRENYKGILDERARGVFHGRIRVREGTQKTDAEQSNRNLLLSPYAEADTKPQLEIYADDVKCAHGATVGQLDDAALFYLRSRGIDEATARNLLIFAFADEVVEAISNSAVRAYTQALLAARLPGGEAWQPQPQHEHDD